MSDLDVSDVKNESLINDFDYELTSVRYVDSHIVKCGEDGEDGEEVRVTYWQSICDDNQELITKQAEIIEGQLKMLEVAGKVIENLESCKDVSDTLAKQRVELCKNKDAEINKLQADNELLREALVNMKEDYLVSMDSPFSQLEYDDELMRATNNALAATAKE